VLVTGNQQLRTLNAQFRRKDNATDVLSFPSDMRGEYAGDIAISAQIAAENAKQLGHSAAEEVKILALHGVLHLAGYDHEGDDGEMKKKEAGLRRRMGLPIGLIERNNSRQARRPSPHKPVRRLSSNGSATQTLRTSR